MKKNEIWIAYGSNTREMARQLAEAADLAGMIGGPGTKIGLKPNLVLASPAENGATTHPGIAEGLIRYLQEKGFRNIAILVDGICGDLDFEEGGNPVVANRMFAAHLHRPGLAGAAGRPGRGQVHRRLCRPGARVPALGRRHSAAFAPLCGRRVNADKWQKELTGRKKQS